MAIPGRASGYGSSAHATVFMVGFTQPLSSKVRYECYDNDNTFPLVDDATTTSNDIFDIGSGENSMIALHDTTAGAPSSTDWFPSSANANTSSLNLMKGLTSYVTQHGATIDSAGGGSIFFNMQVKVPASTQTSSSMGFDLVIRYTYTSTIPTVNWYFNDGNASGTFTTPVWQEMTPSTHGIRHCRAGTASGGPYLANIPSTGQEKTEEAWITT